MSDESPSPMHEALKKYAAQRRQHPEAKGDATLPPHVRSTLQAEVRKQFRPPRAASSPLPNWLQWLIRPAGLGALSAAAVVILGLMIVRHDIPSSSAPEIATDSTLNVPAPGLMNAESQAPGQPTSIGGAAGGGSPVSSSVTVADSLAVKPAAAPQPPVPSPVSQPQPASPPAFPVLPPSPAPTRDKIAVRSESESRDSKRATLKSAAADRLDAPAAATPVTAPPQALNLAKDPRRSTSPAPDAAAPAAGPGTSLNTSSGESIAFRFTQSPAVSPAKPTAVPSASASRGAVSAASPLQEFSVQVGAGNTVEIIDHDGSRYRGVIQNVSGSQNSGAMNGLAEKSDATLRSRQSASKSKELLKRESPVNLSQQSQVSNAEDAFRYQIVAEGTNRSLKERVLLQGELQNSISTPAANSALRGYQNQSDVRSQLGWNVAPVGNNAGMQTATNLQFRGYIQLQNRGRQEINAQQIPER